MEIQIRCFHASGSGNDVLLLQAGMPVQCHDCPLQNYGIRGVLWYQGESNVDRRNEYAALLTAMIADWRSTFGNPELPFYIVELADFLSRDDVSGRQAWAEMRKEQAKVAETNRNTRLIRNSDLGEWNDIHPLDKKTLGQRAAESALENNK